MRRAEELEQIIRLEDYSFNPTTYEHRLTLPCLAIRLSELLPIPDSTPQPILSASLALQLSLALAHLHASGIAHRDIKPANLMLDWEGTLKLIDFATAWTETGPEEREMVCEVGTGCVIPVLDGV